MLFPPPKRQAILSAALRLFAERGFQGASVPEIRSRAGVSINTFYKYFPSKESLANELYRDLRNELDVAFTFFAQDGVSYRRQFHELWTRMGLFGRENVEVLLFLEIWPHAPYVSSTNVAISIIPEAIIRLLEEMRQEKICRDVPTIALASIVWGAFVQLLKIRAQGTVPVPKEVLKAMEDSCWNAICLPEKAG